MLLLEQDTSRDFYHHCVCRWAEAQDYHIRPAFPLLPSFAGLLISLIEVELKTGVVRLTFDVRSCLVKSHT